MKIVTRISELSHDVGTSIGLVPTMGGFHKGHLQLMKTAKEECDLVVASLFVNPTQFGEGEDFERYPRNLERDASLAEEVGVDVLFAPSPEEVYPRPGSVIHVPVVSKLWEGSHRPGHFEGVATVVCKLLNMVGPDVAYFGLKDVQQCLVVKRMVEDLNMPLTISLQPTVREEDGLAMSSRNAYLTHEERLLAPSVYRNLSECKQKLQVPDLTHEQAEGILHHAKTSLEDDGFRVDYFELIELETTKAVRNLSMPCALIAAARLGKTRLIDNVLL